jgi:hypothetical protein
LEQQLIELRRKQQAMQERMERMEMMHQHMDKMDTMITANNDMLESVRRHLMEVMPIPRERGQLVAPPMLPSTSHISDVSTDEVMDILASQPASPPPPSDGEDEIQSDDSASDTRGGAEEEDKIVDI